MSELQTTPRLSLFQIESELLQLIDQLEDALERNAEQINNPVLAFEIAAEIGVIHGLIREYVAREVRKVDGCAFAIKEFEARAAARSQEAERMKQAADRDAETAKRIKQMVLEVMQEFGEKKLPGRLFTITRQGNGGVQALTIAQPDLVPKIFSQVTVRMTVPQWEAVIKADTFGLLTGAVESDPFPMTEKIRAALERGEGVMGCKLEERGEHLRIR